MYYMRRMVSLGIEGGRECQHMRGAKLHAEAASFAALHDDRNTSFCHAIPQIGANDHSGDSVTQDVIMLFENKNAV
jgi:hypothetical protein